MLKKCLPKKFRKINGEKLDAVKRKKFLDMEFDTTAMWRDARDCRSKCAVTK